MIHPRNIFKNFNHDASEIGYLFTSTYLAYYIVNYFILALRFDIVKLEKNQMTQKKLSHDHHYSSRIASKEELIQMFNEKKWQINQKLLNSFENGDKCLLCFIDNELAGYTWVHLAGQPQLIPGLYIKIPATYIYNYAAFTLPKFRGYGLQTYRHNELLNRPEWRDKTGMLGYVDFANWRSKKGQAKSGYLKVGTLTMIGTKNHFLTIASSELKSNIYLGPSLTNNLKEGIKKLIKSIWYFFKSRLLFGILLFPYGLLRHRCLLAKVTRRQDHTYTCFFRSRGQLQALTGPVMNFLLKGRKPEKFLINIFASSNGAEAYSIASILVKNFPDLDLHIVASDLHQELIDQASTGSYSVEKIQSEIEDHSLIEETFERFGDTYKIRPHIRNKVTFCTADLLDSDLYHKFNAADIVFAQNVLFHLNPLNAQKAFENLSPFLKPKSALFIDGMELDLRESLSTQANLTPLNFKCREIHECATKHINQRWWNYYYGLEPYAWWNPDRIRRFSTIFLKNTNVMTRLR